MLLNAITWDVDPVMFEILGREVRWYGLLFALGLLVLAPMILERMWRHERLDPKWMESLYYYVVIATIVGARLGHVLFYDPKYYLIEHPEKILAIWEGGLASHGGTIAIIIAVWIYSRRVTKRSILFTLDRLAVPVGLTAAMIRLGNLMNSEIFGHPTDVPWAFRFVRSAEYHALVPDLSRGCHPTQIYEAIAYLTTFAVCMWLYWRRDAARRYEGLILGVFFIGIFASRLIIESIKNVQVVAEEGLLSSLGMNLGQILSLPFILAGVWLIVRALKRAKAH